MKASNPFPRVRLGDVCGYRTDKIAVATLDTDTYISTENMLPERGGITASAGLPTATTTQAYYTGDVLVSNIRPYFKKIWFAASDGGCSNDVLVFKAKENCAPEYLYYVLSDDKFFDYSTATAKGTKMPRGDKAAIMQYTIPLPPLPVQRSIAATLSCLDDKIELNRRVNANLEAQAQALFRDYFSQRHKNTKGWRDGRLGEIIELHDSKRIPLSSRKREKRDKIYPYYGAASCMDYVDEYLFDGLYILLGEDGTVITDDGYPVLQYVWDKFWVNNHAHVLKAVNGFTEDSLYVLLQNTYIKSIVTGAVQPKISQANLKQIPVIIPDKIILKEYNEIIAPLFACKRLIEDESRVLAAVRDTLLSPLMSGEIEVEI